MTGPTRMVIKSYRDEQMESLLGTYTVRVNPEKYSQSFRVQYDQRAAAGASNATLRFSQMPPQTIAFELLFDATGVIPGSATDLAAELKSFLAVVYDYDGDIHEPRYLRVFWGKLDFTCRLTNMELQYTLFNPAGAPLRARASVTFTNFVDPKTIAEKADQRSADLTHARTVRAGETLRSIARDVYGRAELYVQLARANRLPSTRRLRPGMTILCPPTRSPHGRPDRSA